MKNRSDDLEKKSRELEEREHALNLREDLLEREKALEKRQKVFNDAETKLDVLNKQIKAKEDILARRNVELEDAVLESTKKIDNLKSKEAAVKRAIKAEEDVLTQTKRKETGIESSIRNKKIELDGIQLQIKESKEYLKSQEKLTENTISDWNVTLQEFRNEADSIQREKNKLSADIIRLDQDKMNLTVEVTKIQTDLDKLHDTYTQKVEIYKRGLHDLDIETNNKKNEFQEFDTMFTMRRTELDTREKSLRLKEGSVKAKELELDQKERRLKGAYGMAEIPWDSV